MELKNNLSNWEEKNVSELIHEFTRGISYSSKDISDPNGVPMVNLACIDKSGYYRDGEMKFYSGKHSEAHKIYAGDMLIACTDLTRDALILGTPIKAPYCDEYMLFTMDLAKLVPTDDIDADFMYYALKTNSYRKYIKPWASGTTVLHLNLKGVYDYKLRYPKSKSEQKCIANLLSNLDEKIALNRQINDNLPTPDHSSVTATIRLAA